MSQNSNANYAVTDTQFAVQSWGEWSIPDHIRTQLQPFNAIRLSSGEPDLLGVGLPNVDVLNADAADTPVLALVAKGDNTTPADADLMRGIEQAHARCAEANLGYVAAPIQSVTDTARSLARDLNVGILVCTNWTPSNASNPPEPPGRAISRGTSRRSGFKPPRIGSPRAASR